jgi:hypothetical protein
MRLRRVALRCGRPRTQALLRSRLMSSAAPSRFSLQITPEVEVGVYASFVSIWHNADCFTIDFATVTAPPTMSEDAESGESYLNVPGRIVSRVRIPPSQVFEVMKAFEQQLSAWERENKTRTEG